MTTDTAKKIALGFGVFYLAIGVLGFIPGITVATEHPGHGLLLGIFAVNTLHNLVHLVAGAGLVAAGLSPSGTASMLLWALAGVFALLVPASFIAPVLEAVPLNIPDTLLHAFSALLTGYLAMNVSERQVTARI
ncbi:MAG TPA: DUF4383 domain-containing protein [Chloroflexota bacterium]|nr:DUF4383 domain-containing protein [Chloroflexota bacterium]